MNPTKIRQITNTELRALLTLYAELHDQDESLPSEATIATTWHGIQQNSNIAWFGVFFETILVSTCTIAIIPNLTRACRPYGVVENVVTMKRCRGKGFGKLVLQAALEFAWLRNCYKVMLMTGRLDDATFRFYESAGFSRIGKQAFIARCPPDENFNQ
jgi:GNAT superfamily N-acetyltransferase